MKLHLIFFSLIALIVLHTNAACAHETRPLFIQLTESGDGIVRLSWKTPPSVEPGQAPNVELTGCNELLATVSLAQNSDTSLYSCTDSVSGKNLRIEYPVYNPSISSIISIEFSNGETRSLVLGPDQGEVEIPEMESFNSVSSRYFSLGVHHILSGIDHLLFLAGLLYIARTPRRTLVTITGFTLAHSLTIFLVALGVLRVSVPAVEVVIAFSIVFLATEIARNRKDTLTWRRPVLVATSFGLVHGAGFAAALSAMGLPQTERISALLFFNLGVEAGQISVIAAIFALAFIAIRLGFISALSVNLQMNMQRAFSYGLGVIATFWFVERFFNALL